MKTTTTSNNNQRRGSTLVIVIALLGLLAFVGMVFFSFASSERSSAEYFSEAAKGEIDEPDNVWDHPLSHIISGPSNRPSDRASILRSPTSRPSIARNLVGSDLSPHSGEGVSVGYAGGLPVVNGPLGNDWMNFVDSPAARGGNEVRNIIPPAPDVDYTYPDINNLFLAYKGWAIRDNGVGATPRFERVLVIIPSFFRPQYMKSNGTNSATGSDVPTDFDWASSFDLINRPTAKFASRSFRPSPQHIAGLRPDGTSVFRFLTATEAAGFSMTSGGFPFVPDDNLVGQPGGANGILGELGVWTGSDPDAYELDADNDGDGIREGIWLDTNFPVQEYVDTSGTTRLYTVLHSFTIYDLDGLINLTVHGNMSGLGRDGTTKTIAASNQLQRSMTSTSGLGLGPNEINPLWALRTNLVAPITAVTAAQFQHHYGRLPTNNLEQANMEWLWVTAGRAKVDAAATKLEDLLPGRWGENDRLYNAYKLGGSFNVADLPRPGVSGDAYQTSSSGIRYGGTLIGVGRNGFDDNQDRYDGELNPSLGRVRAFGTPMDYAGTGRTTQGTTGIYNGATFPLTGDVRRPLVHHDATSFGPERFLGLNGYTLKRDVDTSVPRYVFGQNGVFDGGTGDDLIDNIAFDALFEDPLESIFDPDLADRKFDAIFGPQDVFALHLKATDISANFSTRLKQLSPYALDFANAPFSANEQVTPSVRSRFTTISNSLHRFLMRSPFGADGRPGIAGVDDNADGIIDNAADLTDPATSFVSGVPNANGQSDTDSINRAWEFNADSDGADRDGDGFPDGDGLYEFPPAFGTTPASRPYSAADPFRPQVRRLISMESGEGRGLFGQMPLSPNHILDVERNAQTPAEGTTEFLYYMQRAGLRFRPLTDHPLAAEAVGVTTIPAYNVATPVAFPPSTVEQREFWARRDRQKLARDIYVLLYTTGGAGLNTATNNTLDYTLQNDPSLAEGTALYTHDQLRRMAQFAVNLVDSMDSDDVITKFEYDKNLGNGWNLDDDAVTADFAVAVTTDSDFTTVTSNGIYREDQTGNGATVPDRGVVYGVEAQELAISETQGIRSSNTTTTNNASTPYDDMTQIRDFLFVELQNVRPTTVTLGETVSNTAAKAVWRLARYDRNVNADAIKPMAAPDKVLAILQHANNVIDGGGRFSIGVSNDTGLATSAFFVDIGASGAFDGTYELIAPDVASPTLPTGVNQTGSADPAYTNPLVDLDVNHQNHNGTVGPARFAAPSGNFLTDAPPTVAPATLVTYAGNQHFETLTGDKGTFTTSSNVGFDLVLQRRANPAMPELSIGDNPWIDVDRTRVIFETFDVQDGDTAPMIYDGTAMPPTGRLVAVRSTERYEPLDDTRQAFSIPKTATGYRANTIKGDTGGSISDALGINSRSLTDPLLPASGTNLALPFEIWQPHFDREYASTGELLSLPLVGPNLLTQRLNRMRYPGYQQSFPDAFNLGGTQSYALLSTAEAMVLWPNYTDTGTNTIDAARDNRWYRLLQFVEVPSRVHKMLGNYLAQNKIPGKLNINMIRHREVLAGLIDNPYLADVPPLMDSNINTNEDGPFMTSAPAIGGRDLYHDFMSERDGRPVRSYDPVAGASRFFSIPGTPGSHPFRGFGAMGSSFGFENQFDNTILRRLAVDRDENDDGISDGAGDDLGGNRHWLELATRGFHKRPGDLDSDGTEDVRSNTASQRHQVLSKIMNNVTTVSNTFIVYGTAAYFEVHEDVATGLFQVGGRFDLNEDSNPNNDHERAIFVIDRMEAYEAINPGTGDLDWNRLIKARATIE